MIEHLLDPLLNLRRRGKQAVMVVADFMLLAGVVWAAFALRMGHPLPANLIDNWWLLLVLPAVSIPLLAVVHLYREVVHHLGLRAMVSVIYGVSLSTLAFALIIAIGQPQGVPRTAVAIYWLLGLLAVGGSRVLVRMLYQHVVSNRERRHPVAIYGAGHAGASLAKSLREDGRHWPVAFLDDDPELQGRSIEDIPVHAPEAIGTLAGAVGVKSVLLALPSAPRECRRRIVQSLGPHPVQIRSVPDMGELVTGTARLDDIREVEIEDLLGRDIVAADPELLARCIRGRAVMVTGAGGSIGAELSRQVFDQGPSALLLVEQHEHALYTIERELEALAAARGNTDCQIVPVLGSVLFRRQLERLMREHAVATVYHAAAYKHVPLIEDNVLAGVHNNIIGTLRAAEAAEAVGVDSFVLVSTDKAVRPTSAMGASKRYAELVLQGLAARSRRTCFSMVRFGNVLGSSGSVVPLFRQQIRDGGPVTVTHPEVMRYFMTIAEASSLVIQAGAMARGGDVFVLDMGEPVQVDDLARRMIQLSGCSVADDDHPNGDIRITYTGLRPGEKLYEELLLGDAVGQTDHPKIMFARERYLAWKELIAQTERLEIACTEQRPDVALAVLQACVDGFGTPDVELPAETVSEAAPEQRPDGRDVIPLRDPHPRGT